MKKLFLIIVKYLPIIQMVGFIFNATIYIVYDNYELSYTLDFVFGNSLVFTILLFITSYTFGYCNWYRILLITNFINLIIANIDAKYCIPVKDMQILLLYYLVVCVGVILAIYSHVHKIKNNKRFIAGGNR